MKKTKKKMLITAVTAMLACTLSSGLVMTAFADEATQGHEFDARNGDVVFEDFDRANLEGVVSTTTSELTDLGVKPYLHVEYEAMDAFEPKGADESDEDFAARWNAYCGQRNGYIYKQGSGSLAKVKDSGSIRITMRAPEGGVEIGDLCFAVRGVDNETAVLVKNFTELADSEGADMPALTTAWATYEISFAMSYENADVYPTSETPVVGEGSADLMGFHIFPVAGKAGTIDIQSVEYKTTGDYQYLNNFVGGEGVNGTAKAADAGTWWTGSDNGAIVKRMPALTNGGDLLVVKETAVGDYGYAIIEAEGDVAHLKVATTTDGATFGTAAPYDSVGHSVALTGEERGFKFTYDGEESVKIKRIYLTNLEVIVPAVAPPVIDAKTAEYLDDFSATQSGFTGDYDAMVAATEAAGASDMYFRLSYSNGDKVNITNGALVFDAITGGYTQFKFNSKTLHTQKYVVFKMKLEGEDANIDKFRFKLIGEGDADTTDVWAPNFKSGVEYKSKLLEESNPYKDGDWYYVVVDIAESGFESLATGYSGMDLYYEGAGKLYIDEIFFADSADYIITTRPVELEPIELEATTDYAYAYVAAPNADGYKTLCFDVTPAAEDFDISHMRLGFGRADETIIGVCWASQNDEGVLYTRDGRRLDELTYTAGEATHIEIDLEASGITEDYVHVHLHRDSIGAFTLSNVEYKNYDSVYEAKEPDTENTATVTGEMNFTGLADTYAGSIGATSDGTGGILAFDITPANEAFDVSGLRLLFDGLTGAFWGAQNPEGTLVTTGGKTLDELTFTAGEATHVEIDLAASNIGAFTYMHAHCVVGAENAFVLNNVTMTPYKYLRDGYYADALDKLPLYLDNELPTVSITNATTATVGDVITIAYTANDNATAAADLETVITVTKDGEAVTLTDNKFTAAEGVYTVTVRVTDIAGNEATDTKQITVSGNSTTDPTDPNTPTDPTKPSVTADEDDGLSAGAIAGIVIGCVAGVGLLAVGAFFLVKHLRKKKEKK